MFNIIYDIVYKRNFFCSMFLLLTKIKTETVLDVEEMNEPTKNVFVLYLVKMTFQISTIHSFGSSR